MVETYTVERRWEIIEAAVLAGKVDGDLCGWCIPCGGPRLLTGHDSRGLGVPAAAMCTRCSK